MSLRIPIAVVVAIGSIAAGYGQFDPLHNIRWGTFKEGAYSQAKKPFARVIVNEADFQRYWAQNMGESPNAAPRGIDWMKEQLIAIHLGERNSGGYSVRVDSIKRTRAAEITVEYVELTPRKGSINTQALTSPWVLTRMDRVAGNIVFTKSNRTATSSIQAVGCGCCSLCTLSAGSPFVLSPSLRGGRTPWDRGSDREVWWRELESGETSRVTANGLTVIRSGLELANYWSRHSGSSRMPWNEGHFDWRREQLVAIHIGTMGMPGHRIHVDSLERTGPRTMTLRYTVVYPAEPQRGIARMTSPFTLIRMEQSSDIIIPLRRNILPTMAEGKECPCSCGRCRSHR